MTDTRAHDPALGAVSIGIAAAAGPEVAARIAPAAQDAGFRALWVNDTPGHDALEVLAAAATVTKHLVLATGVVPVDRRPPASILRTVRDLGLPEDRLVLGIGSGALRRGALESVDDAARALRSATVAEVYVGALGPRMRALAARAAHGALLSWLTPEAAREQTEPLAAAGSRSALYVRTAWDADANDRLDDEAHRYAAIPSYAAHFGRLGITALDTVIRGGDAAAPRRVQRYRAAVDEVVLRAIVADDTPDAYLRSVHRAAEVVAG
ncbi:MAG: N5,N10-methylene tetrahydromethanopterin reductase [Microbacterium sp.]|uniref:LLM class flavin-dependent oxidoreductase n=1 Tax=Microbacterium sp. TaxID=51671 RepID=UPI000DB2925C|nr:LLM class flavin-dependent oxidoreductase [Microbacterium sp.]PZU40126.1 MAG: N5,N10-methylene tetrahydromethanopterin reductase [Microbacterium sp.]